MLRNCLNDYKSGDDAYGCRVAKIKRGFVHRYELPLFLNIPLTVYFQTFTKTVNSAARYGRSSLSHEDRNMIL